MATGQVQGTFYMTFDTESATIWDLLKAREDLKDLIRAAGECSVDVPENMLDKLSEVEAKISAMTVANRKRALRELKAKRAALATADEKRQQLDAEIAKLEGALK